jgi:hypothetical protein
LWGKSGYEPGEEISGSFFNGYSTVYLIANANCWIENTLELNTPLELELPFENTEAYAKFTPNTTGTYIFTSQDADDIDPTGTLYSSEDLNTQLAYDDDGNG